MLPRYKWSLATAVQFVLLLASAPLWPVGSRYWPTVLLAAVCAIANWVLDLKLPNR